MSASPSESTAVGWWKAIEVYGKPRLLIVLVMGAASGLPLLLVYQTLSAWLAEAGISRTTIGLFSLIGGFYAAKVLWAPLVDRMKLPLLWRLGQRKSWMLLSQCALVGSLVGLGFSDPFTNPFGTAFWAAAVAFWSATQDIVIDAYRIESLLDEEQGAGAGATQLGYRVGMIAGGAGALFLADFYGWTTAYSVMGCFMAAAVLFTLFVPEPQAAAHEDVGLAGRTYGAWLKDTIVAPFVDFFARRSLHEAAIILSFILLYKYGDAVWGVVANPFYLDIGFTKSEIAAVSKTFGVFMTIFGIFAGGVAVVKLGTRRALLVGGIMMALSNLLLAALAIIGASIPFFAFTIAVENFSNGIGGTAFIAFMSQLCSVAYTATQYALLTSLMALTRTVFSSVGGYLSELVNWPVFFIITTLMAIPGLLLLLWLMRRFPQVGRGDAASELSPA